MKNVVKCRDARVFGAEKEFTLKKFLQNLQISGKLFKNEVMRTILTFLIIVSLSRNLVLFPNHVNVYGNNKNVRVCAEIAALPQKLCLVWTSTRDVALRKFNFSKHHRYGLDFQINCNNTSALICILLCGDVATNPGPSKHIKCATLNARSLKSLHKTTTGMNISNINCFQDLVYSDDIDIVCVNETWLDKNISNFELLNEDYTIYRKDRISGRAGGVLIAVKNDSFKSVKQYFPVQSDELDQLEIVSAELYTIHDQKILFCSCYRPPNSGSSWVEIFNIYLKQVCDQFDKVIISGDFNMPHLSWDNDSDSSGTYNHPFIDTLNDYFLTQLNKMPTRSNKILDLLITNVPEHVNITDVESAESASIFTDHCVIHYEFNAFVKTPTTKNARFVYDYKNSSFDSLRSSLSNINLTSCVEQQANINDGWQTWKSAFLSAVSKHVPRKRIKGRKQLPWINGTILNLIKKKTTVHKKLKRSQSEHLREKFKYLRTMIKRMLRESREQFYINLGKNIFKNPKRFWSVMKYKTKLQNIPETISIAGKHNDKDPQSSRIKADNPRDIASLFNNYFASVFDDPSDSLNVHTGTNCESVTPVMCNITLTVDVVQAVLQNLDVTKATGPDNIPARLLKETAPVISESLCTLFNRSLAEGAFPEDWKTANIFPVHKKGKRDYAENYRPISLLPIVSKVLERCVFYNIKNHLNTAFKNSQHGFIRGRSCVTNLLEVLDHIGSVLDDGGQIDTVYLDMSKAFDKVSHINLLHKLQTAGFGGSLLQWFVSYLTNRHQCVTVHGSASDSLPVTSGVPQGSILGPVLFCLYVNDLPDSITSSHIAMFADDTKLFKQIKSIGDSELLQRDLRQLETWSQESGITFNKTKCKSQRITRKSKQINFIYKLNDINLEQTDCERDLGVSVEKNLLWNRQVSEQSSKANKLLGYIKRSTIHIHNQEVKRTMYLALVRPHLGYATQVWAPQSIELIRYAERIQRRATKFILGLPFACDVDYTTRLKILRLLPICYWHELLDMVLFFKITHQLVDVHPSLHPVIRTTRSTRSSTSSSPKYIVPKCKTVTFQRSFIVRTTRIWNNLVDELKLNTESLSSFKTIMLKYYTESLNACFNIDDPRSYKTICPKCNFVRRLTASISCCM